MEMLEKNIHVFLYSIDGFGVKTSRGSLWFNMVDFMCKHSHIGFHLLFHSRLQS